MHSLGLFPSILSHTVLWRSAFVRIPIDPPELILLRGLAQLGSSCDEIEQKL